MSPSGNQFSTRRRLNPGRNVRRSACLPFSTPWRRADHGVRGPRTANLPARRIPGKRRLTPPSRSVLARAASRRDASAPMPTTTTATRADRHAASVHRTRVRRRPERVRRGSAARAHRTAASSRRCAAGAAGSRRLRRAPRRRPRSGRDAPSTRRRRPAHRRPAGGSRRRPRRRAGARGGAASRPRSRRTTAPAAPAARRPRSLRASAAARQGARMPELVTDPRQQDGGHRLRPREGMHVRGRDRQRGRDVQERADCGERGETDVAEPRGEPRGQRPHAVCGQQRHAQGGTAAAPSGCGREQGQDTVGIAPVAQTTSQIGRNRETATGRLHQPGRPRRAPRPSRRRRHGAPAWVRRRSCLLEPGEIEGHEAAGVPLHPAASARSGRAVPGSTVRRAAGRGRRRSIRRPDRTRRVRDRPGCSAPRSRRRGAA